jgi:recombinational DNA repair protein RecT
VSTAIQTQKQPRNALAAWVNEDETRLQIARAVGDTLDADQFASHMLVALNRPEFARCTNASKAMAVLECAALGLLPTAGQVVLIPYKDQLKAMPQWQGYKALMERHPAVLEVQAFLVHVSDAFGVEDGTVRHSYDPLDASRTFASTKDIRGGYTKIVYRDGRPPKFHFTTADQIKKAQGCAQTQNVWKQWFEQMALKTLYRDCYARRAVPVDPLVASRLERVTAADDVILGNDPRQSLPAEGTRSERFLSRVAPEPEGEPESTNPDQAIEDAAGEEVAAGPSGTTPEVGEQPVHPDNAPEQDPAATVADLARQLNECGTIKAVNALVASLDTKHAGLPAHMQDQVRELAGDVKDIIRSANAA